MLRGDGLAEDVWGLPLPTTRVQGCWTLAQLVRLESPSLTANDCGRSTNPRFEAIRAYTAGSVSIKMSNFELAPFAYRATMERDTICLAKTSRTNLKSSTSS